MSRRGWVLFLAMGVIWGVPYLFIKVAVESLTPASLVFLRTTVAALLLVPVALPKLLSCLICTYAGALAERDLPGIGTRRPLSDPQ